jgi:chaperonin GroES
MNITPLRDRILVEPRSAETKTKGGIILPDTTSKERPNLGKVVAIGKGRTDKQGKSVPLQVKAGDNVYFSEYAGTEIEIEGKKHLILKEEDLLAIQ